MSQQTTTEHILSAKTSTDDQMPMSVQCELALKFHC